MAGLLRYQVFLGYAALVIAIWFTLLQNEFGIPKILSQLFPLWVLVTLAMYAAVTIIYGVATLGDFPEASKELEGEIAEAKAVMKKRGIPITGE
jgi:type VI protein secretion system component VasK